MRRSEESDDSLLVARLTPFCMRSPTPEVGKWVVSFRLKDQRGGKEPSMSGTVTGEEKLIERFDAARDVMDYFVLSQEERPNRDLRRVSVDLPVWMVNNLVGEPMRLGTKRQAVITTWNRRWA